MDNKVKEEIIFAFIEGFIACKKLKTPYTKDDEGLFLSEAIDVANKKYSLLEEYKIVMSDIKSLHDSLTYNNN